MASLAEVEARVEEGITLEKRLAWVEALDHYRHLLDGLAGMTEAPALWRVRAQIALREANALMVLERNDEARARFDVAIDEAVRSKDRLELARGLVGAGVFAANSGDLDRGEAFLLRAAEEAEAVASADGRQALGWALLNLGGILGKRGKLDLAFLALHKSRERLFALENWIGVATSWELEARLRETLGDEAMAREHYAEAVTFYRREGMTEKIDSLQGKLGRKAV